MRRTRIKICGVCRPEDARLASDSGADAIGMIFHPASKRFITLDTARAIVQNIDPFVTPVGVFVDAPLQTILDTARALSLRMVQLSGHESPADLQQLAAQGLKIIKAVRVDDQFIDQINLWRDFARKSPALAGILLETANTVGGSGLSNDFEAVARHRASGALHDLAPIIAAGGLHPGNVAGIVRSLRPFAVDVSSGVEETIGQKSSAKVRAFISAVREADLSLTVSA